MARKEASAVRDALVSAIVAMIVAGISIIFYAYKVYWGLLLIIVGAVTFLVVLYYKYQHRWFYRRVVWTCIGLISLFLAIPAIRFSGVLGDISEINFVLESVGNSVILALCLLCGFTLYICRTMDSKEARNGDGNYFGSRKIEKKDISQMQRL